MYARKLRPWSCATAALAYATGEDEQHIWSVIGHDGSEIIWPGLPEPLCRRGFHVGELTRAAMLLGFSMTPIWPIIGIEAGGLYGAAMFELPEALEWPVEEFTGILEVVGKLGGAHALFFEEGVTWDPDTGLEVDWREYTVECVWIIWDLFPGE